LFGQFFLTWSGNISQRWLPKVLSHTMALRRVGMRISRRYASAQLLTDYLAHRVSYRQHLIGLAAAEMAAMWQQ
jgi:hypothetical protein